MTATALLFFALFAVIIVTMYLALRRGWGKPSRVGAIGMVGSIITMTLVMASEPDVSLTRALVMGVLVGAGISGATLIMGWYFQRSEHRRQDQPNEASPA